MDSQWQQVDDSNALEIEPAPLSGVRAKPEVTGAVLALLQRAGQAWQLDPEAAKDSLDHASRLLQGSLPLQNGPRLAKTTPTQGGLAPWQVKRVQTYIEDHISSSLRMADLAKLSQLSPSYFSRAFKISFGEPFTYYVVRRRLGLAKEMMLSSTDSLCQISICCGFSDQAHFSRLFRRFCGVSPNGWRRDQRQAPALGLVA